LVHGGSGGGLLIAHLLQDALARMQLNGQLRHLARHRCVIQPIKGVHQPLECANQPLEAVGQPLEGVNQPPLWWVKKR
jgi:hypothetical protein